MFTPAQILFEHSTVIQKELNNYFKQSNQPSLTATISLNNIKKVVVEDEGESLVYVDIRDIVLLKGVEYIVRIAVGNFFESAWTDIHLRVENKEKFIESFKDCNGLEIIQKYINKVLD